MSAIDTLPELATDVEEAAFSAAAARYAHADTLAVWRHTMAADSETCRRVAVYMDNTPEHAALLFFLLARRICPLVLSPDSPIEKGREVAREIDAQCVLRLNKSHELVVDQLVTPGEPCDKLTAPELTGVYLLTSGSTGRPAVVFRSVASWQHEAIRYRRLLQLGSTDNVVLVSPIYHAYGLGWLWAVSAAGCSLEVYRPTQFSRIVDALRTRATHCALTPACASLLARRAGEGAKPSQLAVVMAGAGPVDEMTDTAFRRAFGIGLARNYGSTETGALFASTRSLPALYVGSPMPNVKVLSHAPPGEAFLLVVELEDGRVVSTGDVLCEHEAGYQIIGRETTSIRRGEAWISPYEIESVLKNCSLVQDCQVRSVRSKRHPGNDHIIAAVVEREDARWDEAELRGFCATWLSPNKVPDVIERVDAIQRTRAGKPARSPIYRWAQPASILEAAGAYKRSMVVFALMEAIGLSRLNGESSVDEIAFEAHVHAGSLGELLDIASRLGMIEEAITPAPAPLDDDVVDLVALERDASVHWNTVEGLTAILQHGRLERPFDKVGPSTRFRRLYRQAMNGPHKRRAAHLVRRRLRDMLSAPYRLLDVSATGGGYATRWRNEDLLAQVTCLPVGDLGMIGEESADFHVAEIADVLRGHNDFDLIIFDNAVHDRQIRIHLSQIIDCLAEGGAIVIDELFLDEGPGSAIGIDWLTHGGMGYPTQECVDKALEDLRFSKHEVMKADRPVCHNVNIYTRT
jgi:long-chain acyl-CoA synthetase